MLRYERTCLGKGLNRWRWEAATTKSSLQERRQRTTDSAKICYLWLHLGWETKLILYQQLQGALSLLKSSKIIYIYIFLDIKDFLKSYWSKNCLDCWQHSRAIWVKKKIVSIHVLLRQLIIVSSIKVIDLRGRENLQTPHRKAPGPWDWNPGQWGNNVSCYSNWNALTNGSVLMASRCLWARNCTPTAPRGLIVDLQCEINTQDLWGNIYFKAHTSCIWWT